MPGSGQGPARGLRAGEGDLAAVLDSSFFLLFSRAAAAMRALN